MRFTHQIYGCTLYVGNEHGVEMKNHVGSRVGRKLAVENWNTCLSACWGTEKGMQEGRNMLDLQ